jgi:hypothetical protein
VRLEERDQRVDHVAGSAFSQHHSVGCGCEGLQEWEEGSARNLGREVEMHSPRGHQGLDFAALEVLLGELSRRLQDEPGEFEHPFPAEGPGAGGKCLEKRGGREGDTEKRKQMGGDLIESSAETGPCFRILCREPGDLVGSLPAVRGDPQIAIPREHRCERFGSRCELQPVLRQLVPVALHERGPGEEIQVRGEQIVAEAGKRDLLGAHRTTRLAVLFEDSDLPAGLGEHHGDRQTVVPGPDHYGVVSTHIARAHRFTRSYVTRGRSWPAH